MKTTIYILVLCIAIIFSGCATPEDINRLSLTISNLDDRIDKLDSEQDGLSYKLANLIADSKKMEARNGSKLHALEQKVDSQFKDFKDEISLKLDTLKMEMDVLYATKKTLSELINRINKEPYSLKEVKVSVSDLEDALKRLELDIIRRRLATVEYELRTQREELLTGASTGYRNSLKSVRECVIELESTISNSVNKNEKYCVFIRDFRTVDDKVTILGDLLSREFTAFLKSRTGLDKNLYREEYVIRLYQQKKLEVPCHEAFNLENLEKSGFPTKRVLIVSGRITPTTQTYRLDVEVTDLNDPQFRNSSSRLIPRDADIDQMNQQVLRED